MLQLQIIPFVNFRLNTSKMKKKNRKLGFSKNQLESCSVCSWTTVSNYTTVIKHVFLKLSSYTDSFCGFFFFFFWFKGNIFSFFEKDFISQSSFRLTEKLSLQCKVTKKSPLPSQLLLSNLQWCGACITIDEHTLIQYF